MSYLIFVLVQSSVLGDKKKETEHVTLLAFKMTSVYRNIKVNSGFHANSISNNPALGPVVRSMVSANHQLSSTKINRLPWHLTLVSANQASSNSALDNKSVLFNLFSYEFQNDQHLFSCYCIV